MPIVKHKEEEAPASLENEAEELAAAFDQPNPVDEYVELHSMLAILNEDPAVQKLREHEKRYSDLAKELRSIAKDEDGIKTITIAGHVHAVKLGTAAEKRTVVDKVKLVGAIQAQPDGDNLLLDVLNVPLGKIDNIFGSNVVPSEIGVEVERTGPRKIEVLS